MDVPFFVQLEKSLWFLNYALLNKFCKLLRKSSYVKVSALFMKPGCIS
jgi:hypothetical protein